MKRAKGLFHKEIKKSMIALLVCAVKVFLLAVMVCAVWLNKTAEQTAERLKQTERKLQNQLDK